VEQQDSSISAADAVAWQKEGKKVILVREEQS